MAKRDRRGASNRKRRLAKRAVQPSSSKAQRNYFKPPTRRLSSIGAAQPRRSAERSEALRKFHRLQAFSEALRDKNSPPQPARAGASDGSSRGEVGRRPGRYLAAKFKRSFHRDDSADQTRNERKQHACKERPDGNLPARRGKGAGKKEWVPWCS